MINIDLTKENGLNIEFIGQVIGADGTLLDYLNKGYIYVGTATPSTTPMEITTEDKVFYIAVEEGDYTGFGQLGITELTILKRDNGRWVAESMNMPFDVVVDLRRLKSAINTSEENVLYVADLAGNIIAKVDSNGISTTDVKVMNNGELKSLKSDYISEAYNDALYVTDLAGNIIAKVDSNGVSTTDVKVMNNGVLESLKSVNILPNQWKNKVLATYGDSVTALNGGDFSSPYNANATNAKWAGKVAKYFNFAKLYNRGIGSTCFLYRNNGGQIAWCKSDTGVYVSRNDSYNYDNYQGNVVIPDDCTPIRGDGSSWLRITTMFPASIKDTIDVILVMFHNDYSRDMDTDTQWVENSTTDPEWAASGADYYGKYNGDYNISTVRGGIASTVMKLQTWMPNALILLMTPISGVHRNVEDEFNFNLENPKSEDMKSLAETVKDISFRMSIPCIDVYGNDCINSLNKDEHITDITSTIGIHPYTDSGCKKIARAIISDLISEIPNL